MLILNLIAQIAYGLLAMTICLPSMQEWGTLLGAPQSSVQITFSAYVLAYGGVQVLYGPLSDRHGRKPVLLVGLALALAGSLLAAFAPNVGLLIVARAIQGAGSAAGMVVGRATVQDLFDGRERTRVMAYIGMAMGVCPPVATILGGQLHAALGWQANFFLMATLAAVLGVAAWRGLPTAPRKPVPPTHWLRALLQSYAQLAREPGFVLNVLVLSFTIAAFYAFLSGAPLVLGSYGVGPARIGFYVMAPPLCYILGNFLTSRLVRVRGEDWMMTAGQLSTLTGLVLLLSLALLGLRHPLAFSMPLMLMGIGHGLLLPSCLARTVGLVPALAGAAAAAAGLSQQLLGAFGAFTVGLVPHEGSVNLGLLMFGFTLASAIAQWLLHRRGRARVGRRT